MNLKKAALINAVGKYSVVIIQLVVSAILARILSPEDYGVIAVVTVFSTFFATIANMGFGTAVIQRKDLDENDINNIYSMTVYISAALAGIFALLSFVIAWFYQSALYIPVTMLLSIALFFDSLNMVPNGILNRDKRFATIALRTVVVYVISAAIAIVLAKLGFKYYSVVIQTIIAAFLTFVWNRLSIRLRYKVKFEMESIRKVANYSAYQFAFNFVNYFAANLDNLLTGKFMGNAELGYYNKSYNLSLYPVNNLTGVISPVLHPILSDYQNDKQVMYNTYLKVVKLLTLVGVYVQTVCFLASREIITIMFGPQWESSIICFHLLSICIIFRMINSSSGAVFQALGNTKLLFQNGLLNTVISVIAILIGVLVFKDIKGLSLCVAIAYVIHYLTATTMLIKNGFQYSLLAYYKGLLKEIVIVGIMIAAAFFDFLSFENIYISAVAKGVYMTAVFGVLLIVTGEYKLLMSLLFRRKKKPDAQQKAL